MKKTKGFYYNGLYCIFTPLEKEISFAISVGKRDWVSSINYQINIDLFIFNICIGFERWINES